MTDSQAVPPSDPRSRPIDDRQNVARPSYNDYEQVISVQDLYKSYGDVEAVRGIDLQIAAGEVFGFLGPNGAGKTTTVEILEGLRPRSSGKVSVLGFDPASQAREVKDRV